MAESDTCVAIHEAQDKCFFYLNSTFCQDDDQTYLDYMYFIFCYMKPDLYWLGVTLCILWLLILFVALGITADDFLCPSLVVITKTLRLSQNIAGVTFLAFGNGAPDIFSSVAGASQERPELVIGTLLGAGIFVTSVVAGSIIATKPFKIMERPFLRDIIFYICAAFWAFLRFYYEEITLLHSIGFIVLYIIYILVVIISRIIYNRYKEKNAQKVPEIEIQNAEEEQKKVSFKPSGMEDDPEAEGVVLRRFSFRGSISVSKHRVSSSHSHHEHVIKAITKAADSTSNSSHTKSLPPPLNQQISKTSLSSLLSRTGGISAFREFLYQVSPIDIEAWHDRSWYSKIFEVVKAPVCFLLIITVPVVDYENDKDNWCKILGIVHCFTSPMFIILVLKLFDLDIHGGFPLWALVLIISVVLACVVIFTSSNEEAPVYHWVFGYLGFITSVLWVYAVASEIVSLLKAIGIVFKLSDAILGLTVLAWGNSIGDFISNLSVARQGYPRMGISACYGGPLLNLLMGIGIPFTIQLASKDTPLTLKYDRLITLLYSTITIILIVTIMTMTALRFQAKRALGVFLIIIYVIFLATAITMETGVI